ncbi:helix-turn-helix domain-containing protein [Streptomyces antarcticus]|uniref:helix-turn-helix domain-containing protein n=1 Tax=Streptomyces antarcticus TaxID=2996458 RepID=UPI00226EBA74|nr:MULTISPECIES: helix-turn-helix domain-containing protein [unclassified Streptomyces]MCY0942588.1 helix-turn-helix domain-containing protein [Streptomyces sp. H34-AA3]MCZ4081334.1 helix-turn-helix domain-containing protein [Streptomyces sp. H34-S5]
MARPITDKDRAAVRRLHAQGMSRNDIARKISRSPSTVSKIAANLDPPLSFDRAAEVATATRVRRADLAARRAELAVTLHDVAEHEVGRMTQPQLYFEWGGKDHTYAQKMQDEPTPADRRTMMATAGTALDRSLKLAPPREEAGEESRSVIGRLMEGLARNYAERHASEAADDAD